MPEIAGFAMFAIAIVVLAIVLILMGAKAVPQRPPRGATLSGTGQGPLC